MDPNTDKVNSLDYISRYPSVPLTNYIFENTGNFTFRNESKKWGFVDPSFSNGAAYGDLDNDGDLDLVINNIDREAFLYRNTTIERNNSNYLKISFDSDPRNYNAKITVSTDDGDQYLEYNPTRGYLSSMDPTLVFGLGSHDFIKSLKIEFLYGKELIFKDIRANRTLKVSINDKNVRNTIAKPPVKLLFERVEDEVIASYKHSENNFWDFTKEVLLPHKQSTNGPHMSVGDINGDGLQDFFVGGARNNESGLFVQTRNGGFVKNIQEDLIADSIYEDMGSVFFDYDNDGDQDLYVVSGGGSDVALPHLLLDRLYVNDGRGNFSKTSDRIPSDTGSGMRVECIDYDSDGDLDLFIGGRIVPGLYPSPPQSYLLENQNGVFRDVTDQLIPDIRSIGMVTDFEWVDFSGDGVIDLVVAGEWMRIEFFEQKSDKFVNVTDQYVSNDTRGWWFSLASGDFDNDGDIDFVGGNLGLNNKFHASEKKPLEIYFNDFDDNGTNDIVLAKTDDEGQNYVMRGKDCSTSQMPFIKDKFEKYEDFAMASITDVFSEAKLNSSLHYSISDFSSVYMKNVGGRFELTPLPIEAQFAPIQDMLVDDFDGDGLLDLIVAGNLFGTEIETTSYDAGTGVFLKGDGKNGFDPYAVHESGLYLAKDLRDLEIIEIGGKKYILGANNDNHLDLFRVN